MAYYENPGMLLEQAWKWLALPAPVRAALHVVIVDDGSPTAKAAHAIDAGLFSTLGAGLASFQLWQMGVDVRWNQDACRNVGVREAPTSWVLLTDMDHVVPPDTWRYLMETKLKKKNAHKFARVSAPALKPYKPHPNSWALTRNLYWDAGGYDEALAGNYGTDGDFLVRLRRVAEVVDLPVPLIRYPRDVIPDASTTTLERKSATDRDNVNRMVKSRGPKWSPLHFSFPCDRVL
jgi:hypothetical protein